MPLEGIFVPRRCGPEPRSLSIIQSNGLHAVA